MVNTKQVKTIACVTGNTCTVCICVDWTLYSEDLCSCSVFSKHSIL